MFLIKRIKKIKLLSDKNQFCSESVLILYALLLSCLLISCGKNTHSHQYAMPPVEVETITISLSTKAKIIESVGELVSPQTTEVSSENMGKIVYLNIPEGKEVGVGHILARIDDSTTQADIKVANAKLKNAGENYKRMETLKNEGAISQQALDNALEVLQTAEGEAEKAESVEIKTTIAAPFSGVLSLRKISLGEFIDSGDPIVRISQINPLHLVFSLPEQYASQIKIDQSINFMVSDSSKDYSAKISAIDPYIDPASRMIQIKAIVSNPNKELLPGRFTTVSLEVGKIENAILIPQEALIQEGDKKSVAVVDKDNTVIFKEVSISRWDQNSIFISDGLINGDVVITSGHQKVHSGSKVIPKESNSIHNQILDKKNPQ